MFVATPTLRDAHSPHPSFTVCVNDQGTPVARKSQPVSVWLMVPNSTISYGLELIESQHRSSGEMQQWCGPIHLPSVLPAGETDSSADILIILGAS